MTVGVAISGGGSAVAWSVGVLCYLLDHGTKIEAASGISAGSIAAAQLCMFDAASNMAASRALKDSLLPVKTRHIWRHRIPLLGLHGLWLSSFLDATPLRKRLRRELDADRILQSGRLLRVGATRDDGSYRVFTELDSRIVDGVVASASFPGAFQPVAIEGERYTDGGLTTATPIRELIDAGCSEIYAITCHPEEPQLPADRSITGLERALRAIDLLSARVVHLDLELARAHNRIAFLDETHPKRPVKLRVFRPLRRLTFNPLRFDPASAMKMFDEGYACARTQMRAEKL